MKLLVSYLTLGITVLCVLAIAVIAGLHHPVPTILAAVALGALTGQFALLTMPSFGPVAVVVACVVAIGVLAGLNIAVPNVIGGLLVAAVTGHFALSLPNSSSTSAVAPPAQATAPPAPATTPQPAPAVSVDPNQPAGLSITP